MIYSRNFITASTSKVQTYFRFQNMCVVWYSTDQFLNHTFHFYNHLWSKMQRRSRIFNIYFKITSLKKKKKNSWRDPIYHLGAWKDQLLSSNFLWEIRSSCGYSHFPKTGTYMQQLENTGIKTGVVSRSIRNTAILALRCKRARKSWSGRRYELSRNRGVEERCCKKNTILWETKVVSEGVLKVRACGNHVLSYFHILTFALFPFWISFWLWVSNANQTAATEGKSASLTSVLLLNFFCTIFLKFKNFCEKKAKCYRGEKIK